MLLSFKLYDILCLKCDCLPGLRPRLLCRICHPHKTPAGTITVRTTADCGSLFSRNVAKFVFHNVHTLPLSQKLDPPLRRLNINKVGLIPISMDETLLNVTLYSSCPDTNVILLMMCSCCYRPIDRNISNDFYCER